MQSALLRWMNDFHIDGIRMDSVENVFSWNFIGDYRALATNQLAAALRRLARQPVTPTPGSWWSAKSSRNPWQSSASSVSTASGTRTSSGTSAPP